MQVYGITGTNGKTTTAYALHSILAGAYGEGTCGLMTTVETVSGGEHELAVRTTPEAVEVQETLAAMLEAGVRRVAMEVSSHGIELRRVQGTRFEGALFTNLTRDHLDLHGSMQAYYEAKRELFLWAEGAKLANSDDAWGRRLIAEVAGVKSFGVAGDADYRVGRVEGTRDWTSFVLHGPNGDLALETPLLGPYNVLNVAGAVSLALEAGVEREDVVGAVREMGQVPGRFEVVAGGEGFEVIVDYAHTDVGLEAVLAVARGLVENGSRKGGRVICVFGAAGERDGDKRPKMGRVAARLADLSIVTTDDAYAEDPAVIAGEIAAGSDPTRTEVLLDRREAIRARPPGGARGGHRGRGGQGAREGSAPAVGGPALPRRHGGRGAVGGTGPGGGLEAVAAGEQERGNPATQERGGARARGLQDGRGRGRHLRRARPADQRDILGHQADKQRAPQGFRRGACRSGRGFGGDGQGSDEGH